MFLSIIIPIYNDEKYLNECLASCLNQDYPKDDYEIICVDDGSTDRTPEMLREYAEKNTNIRLHFVEHGKGGRAVGFPLAKGDYIWFVDHDDIIAPNSITELKQFLDENPTSQRVTFPYYEFFDQMTEKELKLMAEGRLTPNDNDRFLDMVVWDSLFKRSFLLDHDIDPRSKRIKEAADFWGIQDFKVYASDTVFVRECIENGIESQRLETRPLYHYRRHENSESIDYSPEATKKREKMKYHRVLLYLYLALGKKNEYQRQRRENGSADPDTTVDAIVSLRWATAYLASLPRMYWVQGMELAREKKVFFPLRVPEYHFTYHEYLMLAPLKKRFLPSTSAAYYSYSEFGTRLMRATRTFSRAGAHNQFVKQTYTTIRKLIYSYKG